MNTPHLKFEKKYWKEDNSLVCGADEVGRGCLAGPVVVCAIIMPKKHKKLEGVRDSKKISQKKRENLFERILSECIDFGIGLVPANVIDKVGITKATSDAFRLALNQINTKFSIVLIDGRRVDGLNKKQKPIIAGDQLCYTISCASIVAKVVRDQIISGLEKEYEDFSFSSHKGYGTKKHRNEIILYGKTSEHRESFLSKLS